MSHRARFPTTLRGQLRQHAGSYALGAALLLAQQSLMFWRDWLFKTGIDAAGAARGDAAVHAGAVAMAVIVVAAGVRVASRVVMFNAGRRVEYELRGELLASLHRLGPSFFRKIPTGDILSRATNDLTQVRLLLGFGVLNVINTAFALVSALSLMVGVSWRLTLASLVGGPVLVVLTRWFSKQVFGRTRENQEALGQLSDRVQASLAGVRVVRSLSLEDAERASFDAASAAYLVKSLRLAQIRGLMFPIMGVVSALGLLGTTLYGSRLVARGDITQGDFIAFWAAFSRLVWPLLALGFVAAIVARGKAGHDRLRAIYEAEADVVDGPLPAPARVDGALRVTSLTYAVGDAPLLRDVSFEVPAGASLAIVGRTGSGKSVLASLLPRLSTTPRGAVYLDGVDVVDLPLASVRRAIGYAQQDAFLFSTTVARNIALSLDEPEADGVDARVRQAADDAGVRAEIEALPDGFATVVGERGVQLSGGQRQRVALARAFLREPAVLVLDDPLSAVDAKTEARILDAILERARRCTLVLITHRVSAAARCDRVVVLDHGAVREAGTHAELLAAGGVYAAIAAEQARGEGEP
ncbi:MAG: ABC transporter ATP-binding protein [Polyangiaceae bacterium]|nr:ABC transporter ATP-binding protein [Polyangiaceae bacterium]